MATPQPLSITEQRKRLLPTESLPDALTTNTLHPSKISKFLKDKKDLPLTKQMERQFKELQSAAKLNRSHTAAPNLVARLNKDTDQTNLLDNVPSLPNSEDEMETDSSHTKDDSQIDNEGWKSPKKTISGKNSQLPKTSFTSTNRFAALQQVAAKASLSPQHTQAAVTTQNKKATNKGPDSIKKTRSPPIYCKANSTKQLIADLTNKAGLSDFQVKRTDAEDHVLQTLNLTDFEKAKSFLVDTNTPFFTYTPQSLKKKYSF